MEPSQNQISLKMIPRIDFDRIKARMSLVGLGLGGELCRRAGGPLAQPAAPLPPPPLQKDWFAKRKKFKRPPQRLFDAEKIR